MITRTWRGWTARDNADAYAMLLREEILPSFAARGIDGYRGTSVARRDTGEEIEFLVMMWFDSLDAIRTFAGEHFDVAVVPDAARKLLRRFDERALHYETLLSPPEFR